MGLGRGDPDAEVGRAAARPVPPRRAGDVAVLVADIDNARALLGWQPRRSLAEMIADAVASRRG